MSKMLYKLNDFEGPLDLLLKLIDKKKIDISDIKISKLLEQYMEQINIMRSNKMEIKSEFLEMASSLIYIKTVSLLPNNTEATELKNELSNTLSAYQDYKDAAQQLSQFFNINLFVRNPESIKKDKIYTKYHNPAELLKAYSNILLFESPKPYSCHNKISDIVSNKIVSVFSRVVYIFRKLINSDFYSYNKLFHNSLNKSNAVATFLAVLELIKNKRIFITENNNELILSLNKEKL